ncbi:MAG: PEPxxWA-CTERM sorting domain-containing protein [Sphingomicrobium sp.]
MIASAKFFGLPIKRRHGAALALALGLAGVLSVATVSKLDFGQAVGSAVGKGLNGIETVAAMLAERSPGPRPDGALAALKHKRQAALHERSSAAPGPVGPLATIMAAPLVPPIVALPPVATPLFNVVGPPPVVVPAAVGAPGGPPGGVPSIAPPGGGGGGGIVVPPIITSETPVAPVTPLTPATPVPEPASWAMMLLGLGLLGFAARRRSPAATR